MARKKSETPEVKNTKEKRYFQVVKTLKDGTVMMIKGYNKEVKK